MGSIPVISFNFIKVQTLHLVLLSILILQISIILFFNILSKATARFNEISNSAINVTDFNVYNNCILKCVGR